MTARPPRPQQAVPYTRADGSPGTLGVSYTDPATVPAGRPPAILIHGIWGDMRIWQSRPPAPLAGLPGGSHWGPPFALPQFQHTEAPWTDPTGLWEALETAGFAGVSWRQVDASGGLPGGTEHELAAVVDFALATYGATQVYLVGHSRGGLVARAYLMDPAAAPKVAVVVTLGTPLLGTRLATVPEQVEGDLARALLAALGPLGILAGPFVVHAITRLLNDVLAPWTADFEMIAWEDPPNPRLTALLAGSWYPAIRYVAIAGVYPHVLDARLFFYGPASLIPQGFPPHFTWQVASYPPAESPAAAITLLFGQVADAEGLAAVQAMPELYPADAARARGGDGAVAQPSAQAVTFPPGGPTPNVALYAFPTGHSLLARLPEVQATVVAELSHALGGQPSTVGGPPPAPDQERAVAAGEASPPTASDLAAATTAEAAGDALAAADAGGAGRGFWQALDPDVWGGPGPGGEVT